MKEKFNYCILNNSPLNWVNTFICVKTVNDCPAKNLIRKAAIQRVKRVTIVDFNADLCWNIFGGVIMLPKKKSLTIEFKSDKKRLSDAEIFEAVVAFANTEGGELYLGIEDDGEVTGVHKVHENTTTVWD